MPIASLEGHEALASFTGISGVILNLYIQLKDGTRCSYTRTYPVRFQYVESFDEYNNLLRGSAARLEKVPYAKLLYRDDKTVENMIQREIGLRYWWEY